MNRESFDWWTGWLASIWLWQLDGSRERNRDVLLRHRLAGLFWAIQPLHLELCVVWNKSPTTLRHCARPTLFTNCVCSKSALCGAEKSLSWRWVVNARQHQSIQKWKCKVGRNDNPWFMMNEHAKDPQLNSPFAQTSEGLFTLPGTFSVWSSGRTWKRKELSFPAWRISLLTKRKWRFFSEVYVGTSSAARVMQLSRLLNLWIFSLGEGCLISCRMFSRSLVWQRPRIDRYIEFLQASFGHFGQCPWAFHPGYGPSRCKIVKECCGDQFSARELWSGCGACEAWACGCGDWKC